MKIIRSKDKGNVIKNPLLEEFDIFSELTEKKGTSLFLGKYSLAEVEAVLRKRNFMKEAKKRSLWPLDFEMDSSEFPPLQRFKIYYKNKSIENLIVDLKIKEAIYRPKADVCMNISLPEFKFLNLDWLTLQNPTHEFSREKSPLPGQVRPGLSLGKKVKDLFVYLAKLLKSDGLLAFPAYFHNAILFSRSFKFLNPVKEGEVLSIRKTFSEISFKQLAWIVHLNCLKKEDGTFYEWKAEEQIYPLHKDLDRYFNSKIYREKVKSSQSYLDYSIDWQRFNKKYTISV